LFLDKRNSVLYVGKAKNLKERVSSYFSKSVIGEKTRQLVSRIDRIKVIETYSEIGSLILEANLIKKYRPQYNIRLVDDKAYLYIKITIKDLYPKILTSRMIEEDRSLYFGPYPSAKSLRLVLKTIRKIFPFQSVSNHPKTICLYNHLGLCPCPEVTKPKDYKKRNIKYIIRFLKGKNRKIIEDLEKERDLFSKNEEFEKASEIQEKISAIKLISNSQNAIFDYETNPNLASDSKKKEIDELLRILNPAGYKLNKLHRIECFDISNMSGFNQVASMIVFINGVEQKSEYRKFKIKELKPGKQNDVSAMNETLTRRFNHLEWEFPDLIVVDGGKAQVGSALAVLKTKNIRIPVIGLAKKEEKIVTEDFKLISLRYDSLALLLLRRIRDEAHRFAVSYHKKLRSKSLLFG
jgi:excinuclease ABC subunit C